MNDDDEKLNLDDYVQTRLPDRKEIARLLELAKGLNRSMGQFARNCGYSPVLFSRIKNQRYTDPLDKKLLYDISEHSEGSIKQLLLHKLLLANGMTEKRYCDSNVDQRILEEQEEREKAILTIENEIKELLTISLFKRDYAIKRLDYIPDDDVHPMIAGYLDHQFVLQISDFSTRYICFQFLVTLPDDKANVDSPTPQSVEKNYTVEAHKLLTSTAELFLMSHWYPDNFKDVRTILVLNDESLYNEYIEKLTKPVDSEMSVILVDTDAKDVTNEWCLKRSNGKELNPLFGNK